MNDGLVVNMQIYLTSPDDYIKLFQPVGAGQVFGEVRAIGLFMFFEATSSPPDSIHLSFVVFLTQEGSNASRLHLLRLESRGG